MNIKNRAPSLIIGIDALRSKSGGAKAHLIGIISNLEPEKYDIKEVHVWSYRELLEKLPNTSWLKKHAPIESKKNIFSQLYWQRYTLLKLLQKHNCDILLNLDAGTINNFSPSVTMSRDMLSYEPGEMERYKYSLAWLRLYVIKYVQAWSLKRSNSVVFLTKYASKIIQDFTGPLEKYCYIPHGVGSNFHKERKLKNFPNYLNDSIKCIYVSNIAPYKHQKHVIRALKALRKKGYKISLELVGENMKYINSIKKEIAYQDDWIKMYGHVDQRELPNLISDSDIFIFASSCENMPNTLVEGMAIGIPIACSNRGPMPEILENGGLYFDPEDNLSIYKSIEEIILNHNLRKQIASEAKKLSKQYSWKKCSDKTFKNIVETFNASSHVNQNTSNNQN